MIARAQDGERFAIVPHDPDITHSRNACDLRGMADLLQGAEIRARVRAAERGIPPEEVSAFVVGWIMSQIDFAALTLRRVARSIETP